MAPKINAGPRSFWSADELERTPSIREYVDAVKRQLAADASNEINPPHFPVPPGGAQGDQPKTDRPCAAKAERAPGTFEPSGMTISLITFRAAASQFLDRVIHGGQTIEIRAFDPQSNPWVSDSIAVLMPWARCRELLDGKRRVLIAAVQLLDFFDGIPGIVEVAKQLEAAAARTTHQIVGSVDRTECSLETFRHDTDRALDLVIHAQRTIVIVPCSSVMARMDNPAVAVLMPYLAYVELLDVKRRGFDAAAQLLGAAEGSAANGNGSTPSPAGG
jgi:hypothetical protein